MATRAKTQTNSRSKALLVETRNDLSEDSRRKMVQLCNEQLADTFDLFSQTKQAHWNVKGPDFYQLHELYDELAEKLLAHVDTIAERATALGGAATGTVRMSARASRLEDYNDGPVDSMESVRMLAERYAGLAHTTREAIDQAEEAKDMDTSDLFIDVSRDLDKALWFLEAHLQGRE